MKHNLKIVLINFAGMPFVDGPDKQPLTLQMVLENACCAAPAQEFGTGDKKHEVYKVLEKVHAADPFAELTAEEVALRSEEHTSELQSQSNLVCRLLLEKK